MTISEHSRLLAGFLFFKGALGAVFWVLAGGPLSGAFLPAIFAAFFMFAGWKVESGSPDSKMIGIVASVLCLFSFPFGTAIGIYGLWFFLMRAKDEF